MAFPLISIIINTNGRCLSLMKAVAALEWQRYQNFEICIVVGPKEDGSAEFAQELAAKGRVKAGSCTVENLSVSRNIGIDLAAGELVAFLDDDALPEPVWLEQLAAPFDRPDVSGASGLVFQPNGRDVQFRYSSCDRFGETTHLRRRDLIPDSYPFRLQFPHVMGANCMFRRNMLIDIGGFDEEFDYYLDEADLCCRLIDAGGVIRHVAGAPVHHKYLSGATRDSAGITVRRRSIIKNQIYFSLKNGGAHAPLRDILERSMAFADWHRRDLADHVRDGRLPAAILAEFDQDMELAWQIGLTEGLKSGRKVRRDFTKPAAFRHFPRRLKSEGRHIAVIQPFDGQNHEPEDLIRAGHIVRTFEALRSDACKQEGADFVGVAWRHQVSPEAELTNMNSASSAGARPLTAAETRAALARALDRVAAFHPFDEILDFSHETGAA